MVDEQKIALQVQAVNISQEDGTYTLFTLGENKLDDLLKEMDVEKNTNWSNIWKWLSEITKSIWKWICWF